MRNSPTLQGICVTDWFLTVCKGWHQSLSGTTQKERKLKECNSPKLLAGKNFSTSSMKARFQIAKATKIFS